MLSIVFYLLLLSDGILMTKLFQYRQSDYKIISERFEFTPNDRYYADFKYTNYKYNRTFAALNISAFFKVDFRYELKAVVQGYKFASNEYRSFPIVFDAEVCELLNGDLFGLQNLYTCGYAPRCPIVKRRYSTCKWQPDYNKFPPYLPSGRYRIDLNLTYRGEGTLLIQWYMTVARDPLMKQ